MNKSFKSVTELTNENITSEQLLRLHHRYFWAKQYCQDKDVVEVACGSGPGLHILKEVSKTLTAGDVDKDIVDIANQNYDESINIERFDASKMPCADCSKDVIIIFEAVYYLPNFDEFLKECNRVLRQNGLILICSANKDLFDFNPSPFSHEYYGILELKEKLKNFGEVSFYGFLSIKNSSILYKLLRPIKKIISFLGIFPKTMRGKEFLKKIIFGKLIKMPKWLTGKEFDYLPPKKIHDNRKDLEHKVIYCVFKKNKK